MATAEISTGDYSMDDRVRLGLETSRARRAAGWRSRKAFALAAGVSLRSVAKLESPIGELPVGASVLDAVGRTLPAWTADTPRIILEGGASPQADSPGSNPGPDSDEAKPKKIFLTERERTIAEALIELDYSYEDAIEKIERLREVEQSRNAISLDRKSE